MDVSRVNRIGGFPYGYDNFKKELEDGINAVNTLELWDWLKSYDLDSDRFGEHPNIGKIDSKLKYLSGHSGGSHGFMMSSLIYIAKHGFEDYVLYMNKETKRPPTPVPHPVSPVHNRANTGGAMPRRVCMCRAQKGFNEGWCSFASMGQVPGCEY
jgi:hypothetical protein